MSKPTPCQWTGLGDALTEFAQGRKHQSQNHIKPLHWYVACRLVIEGGFPPDEVWPTPPFKYTKSSKRLSFDFEKASHSERTVFGGLKTKKVDVVVSKDGVGPVLAVSLKGVLNAHRNLTNRMEEAAGDCTNIHMAYPGLVYGYWAVLRANREGKAHPKTHFELDKAGCYKKNDIAVSADGSISSAVERYHHALTRLSDRKDLRDSVSRYEACGVTLVAVDKDRYGEPFRGYPPADSPLLLDKMFERLYAQYDLRFVYQAPDLSSMTKRLVWAPDSPAISDPRMVGFAPRVGRDEFDAGDAVD